MNDDNVVDFGGVTALDLTPDRVIQSALDAKLKEVVIVGFTRDGELYFKSSTPDAGNVIWQLEMAKLRLLKVGGHDE